VGETEWWSDGVMERHVGRLQAASFASLHYVPFLTQCLGSTI